MEVVANNYLPGDQRLVDKIVYDLKAQGVFDQLRKECFADVDTKPAYQNLRQRVEGSVAGFLKEQSWRPDMNKNQVREMLRKTITESGYLETGVERIVDQVVNPKINTVVLPKVEEVVYNYLGIKKPNKNETIKNEPCDLLPQDLEAVSPESEPVDKKDEKSTDTFQDLDETKTEEDESPPFEPLEEQSEYVPQEENSVDSHLSGFSGLVSHESNQSNENKVTPMEQDSQMSRNSSDSRLSIVTSDENSKMEVCEDSQKSSKDKPKPDDKHKSRSDKDRRSKDSRSRHSSSSKDKDKSRDRKDSKTSKDKDKERVKSSSKHGSHSSNSSSSSSKDKNGKERRDSSRSDKDKKHKDSRKSGDSKTRDKSSSSHKHSSHSDKHKKDKDKKKEKSKDDHYSSKDKKNDRRSTDRDSNDGQSHKPAPETHPSQSQKSQESSSGSTDTGNSNHSDNTTKAPVIITGVVEDSEVSISTPESQKLRVFKPKCASNMQEALRLRKIRKQLAKLEKQNQLSLTSVNLDSPILLSASINLDDLNQNRIDDQKLRLKQDNSKMVSELEVVPSPLQNTVISQDNWDAMEAKLREEVCSEFMEFDDSLDEESKISDCKFFESVDPAHNEFLVFIREFIKVVEKRTKVRKGKTVKRKIDDLKNNNRHLQVIPDKKVKVLRKNRERVNNHSDISEKFPLPLSPAESEKSLGKKEEHVAPLRAKRNSIMSNQRYSSDDLYKPRPTFASSRRRGAKNLEN